MRPRLRCVLALVTVVCVNACDTEPNAQPGNTTTTNGMSGGAEDAESGDPDTTGGSEACVPPGSSWPCNTDEQCQIAGDCCGCTVYNQDNGSPGNCGGLCEMNKCEEWGISEAACRAGRCEAVGLSCNQALVVCDAPAPVCEAGSLPQVSDGCFTGACLPFEACDWAPSCDACGAEQLCMHEQRSGCDYVRCVNVFSECQNQGPCCVGESWCDNGQCTPTADGFACAN
jgi:hypothetical protein